jgi:hypothetical protein
MEDEEMGRTYNKEEYKLIEHYYMETYGAMDV